MTMTIFEDNIEFHLHDDHPPLPLVMTKDDDDYGNDGDNDDDDDDEVPKKTYRASLAPQTSVN